MLLLLLDIAVVFEVLLLLFMTVPELGKQIASVLSRSEKKKQRTTCTLCYIRN